MKKIYRGFSRPMPPGEHINPFLTSPRNPTHTPKPIHEFADLWFKQKFGVSARSTTVICTTDLTQAKIYSNNGSILEINPIGAHSIIYSPYVRDFLDIYTEINEISFESVSSCLETKNYQFVNSKDQIDKSFLGEILVSCERYIASTL